jgi:hypothetical protein
LNIADNEDYLKWKTTSNYLKWNISATTDQISFKFETYAEGNKLKLRIPCEEGDPL